ncbi:hypothetical protein Pve01_88990 [Planomonospora venezuelensis]|nr:hypothetical protein Pve01_88990 [Planomonospora venezuelensis]
MNDAQWEVFSYQGVIAAAVLYFLAMMAYFFELASLRTAAKEVELATVAHGPGGADAGVEHPIAPTRRTELAARLGLVLTGFAVLVHLVALVARGLAADPNRVPWGNMYEFTIAGTFVVALIFVLATLRIDIEWLGPLVTTFVVAALMAAFLGLDDAVLPLPDALNSPWLVIHVVSAVISTGAFTVGALLPLLIVAFVPDTVRVLVTVLSVVAALALTGFASARIGYSPRLPAVVRNVSGGLLAMGVTYLIGMLAGTQLG